MNQRVVIYARTDDEDETRINEQVTICQKYVNNNNLEVVNIFKEYSYSNTSIKRPLLDFAITECQLNNIDTILIADKYIIGSNKDIIVHFVELAKAKNVTFTNLAL